MFIEYYTVVKYGFIKECRQLGTVINLIDTDNRATLKVPRELAEKLKTKAKRMGIQGRAPWAIYAKMVLAQAVKEGSA